MVRTGDKIIVAVKVTDMEENIPYTYDLRKIMLYLPKQNHAINSVCVTVIDQEEMVTIGKFLGEPVWGEIKLI